MAGMAIALDGCSIHRREGVEIVAAEARSRVFPLRVGESFGVCLKYGPAHVTRFEGRRLSFPADSICVRPPGSVWSSEETGPVGFLSLDVERPFVPEGLSRTAVTFVPSSSLRAFRGVVDALMTSMSPASEIIASLFADLDAASILTADELHVRDGHALAGRARAILGDASASAAAPSVEEVARMLGTNRFAVMRAFKRRFGITPHAYLVRLRIERARERIAAGAEIVSAALENGFADQAHFTRAFKRNVGVTPGAYARDVRRALLFKPLPPSKPMLAAWKSSTSSPVDDGSPPTSTSPTAAADGPGSSSSAPG